MCQARAVERNELKEPSTMEITTVEYAVEIGAERLFAEYQCGWLRLGSRSQTEGA